MGTGIVFLLSLILIGAIQGLIIVCLLLNASKRFKALRYLSGLVFLIALANLNAYFLPQQLSPFWQRIGNVFPLVVFMPIGPLLWLYIRACISGTYFSKKEWLHFLPILFDLFPYTLAAGFYLGFFQQQRQLFELIDHYNIYVDILRWLSLSIYLWLCYRILSTAQKKEPKNPLFFHAKKLLFCFIGFQLVWFVFLVPYSIPQFSNQLINAMGWFPVYIPLSMLIYAIGILSYQVLRFNTIKQGLHTLAPSTVTATINLLTRAMETDQLYLKPNLDLAMVMAHTGLPQKTISAVLNQHYHKSFNEFVNHYRIESVKQKLEEGKSLNYTLNGIAAECGFNSQATFQRTFKQMVGITPSQYLQKTQENLTHI